MIKRFLANKTNLTLMIIFICSLLTYFSYELTTECEEWFVGADMIYSFFSKLSISYICSFIFYILQIYIPENEKRKKVENNIKWRMKRLIGEMEKLLGSMCGKYLEMPHDSDCITDEQLTIIGNNIDVNDTIKYDYTEMTLEKAISISKRKIEGLIEEVLMCYGSYMDEELIILFDNIINASLFKDKLISSKTVDTDYTLSILYYYHQCEELRKMYIKYSN